MTKKTNKTYWALGLTALTVGLASSAQATISYTIGDGGLEAVNVTLDSGTYNGILAGGIKLTSGSSSYVSVCTDFLDSLYLGNTYTYNSPVNVSTPGLSGNNPAWGQDLTAGEASLAIKNAAEIFYTGYNTLQTGTTDQKAAIQLAVWTALYNTTADGSVDLSGRFGYTGALSGDVSTLLAELNSPFSAPQVGLLIPNPENASNGGNDHLDGQAPQAVLTPVPEASTVVAGGLLLLPFALCSLKSFRKSRV